MNVDKLSPDSAKVPPVVALLMQLGRKDLTPGGLHGIQTLLRLTNLHASGRALLIDASPALSPQITATMEAAHGWHLIDHAELASLEESAFDVVAMQGFSLTGMPRTELAGELRRALSYLKPGGTIALHDLIWRQQPGDELLQDLVRTWGWPAASDGSERAPLMVYQWWQMLEEAGCTGMDNVVGALPWFRRKQLLRDEGPEGVRDLLFTLLESQTERENFLRTYQHFTSNERFYGYGVFTARAPQLADSTAL